MARTLYQCVAYRVLCGMVMVMVILGYVGATSDETEMMNNREMG